MIQEFKTLVQEHPSDSDEELARQTQAGSLAAFEQLVYRYEGRVHAFVARFCRNATDARRTFATWLFTIARRKCIDRHRAAPSVADDTIPELHDDADPSELTARREEGQNLWRLARERLGEN